MKKTKMLKKNYEFKQVLSKGTYYSGKCIEAFIKKSNRTYNNLGIAVSVKISNAVMRNKIKRLIRENYRNIENEINSGYSIVFLWKKKANTQNANYNNIKKDISNIFDKAKIIIEDNE